MIDWSAMLPAVDDRTERARLARWAVSLRRAQAAGTGQTQQGLASLDYDETPESPVVQYCCLGIWCEIEHAAGRVERRDPAGRKVGRREFRAPGGYGWDGSTLPLVIQLDGADNPDLLRIVTRDGGGNDDLTLEEAAADRGYWLDEGRNIPDVDRFVELEAETCAAAELNDGHHLSFGEIADVVVWRYALTAEELATAEAMPRVPEVEGPAPEIIGMIFP